jgi:hypothetical protein
MAKHLEISPLHQLHWSPLINIMLNTPVFSFLTAAMTIAGLNLLGI